MSKYQVFNPYKRPVLASAGRPDRSTELGVGRPSRSTDVHRRARQSGWRAGRPRRSTVQRALLFGKPRSTGPVDRTERLLSVSRPRSTGPFDRGSNGQKSDHWWSTGPVDRTERLALCILARSTDRSTDGSNGLKYDRRPDGRPTGLTDPNG